MRVRELAPLMAVIASLVAAAPASAGTASVTGNGQSKTLHYDAVAGEQNVVWFTAEAAGKIRVWEQGAGLAIVTVTPGPGCIQDPSNGDTAALCDTQGLIAITASLGDGDDQLYAYVALPTSATGGDGADVFNSSPMPDTFDGGPGTDSFFDQGNGDGADVVIGGDGHDKVDYSNHTVPLSLTLNGLADDGATGEGDNIHTDVEQVIGGQGNDVITGTSGPDDLRGAGGEDTITAGAGNDYLQGDGDCGGADHLYGGDGADIVISRAEADIDAGPGDDAVYPGLICAGATVAGGDGTDRIDLIDAQGLRDVSLNGLADDGPTGTGAANVGSDFEQIGGSRYDDRLVGGAGSQVIDGAEGNDVLDGGPGADSLSGGDGFDAIDYSARVAAVTVAQNGTADDGESAEGDNVADDIEGIYGGAGNDVLSGGPADNVLDGGPGADQLSGGAGQDAVDYTLRSAPVTADTSGSAGDDGEAGEGDSIASDVEDLFGGAGGDSLTGSAGANVLDGGGGGDTLVGGDAGDTLLGGDGNDSLDGGPGTDQFSADGGDDTILMQDTLTEHAGCGDGTDNVSADRSDIVDLDCEQVTRAARITRTPLPIRPPRTPTTSTPPIVPAVVDTTAPRGTLAISPLRLRRALKIGQRVSVTCDTACSSRIELQLSAKAARRLGLKGSKGPVIVATGVRSAVNSRHYVIVIRFASKLRSRLAKAKTLSLRLHAVFADAADNERSTLRRLVLRR